MAAISDFLRDIVNFEQCRRALGTLTKRPHALHAHQQAFDGQLAQARLMVMRLTPNCWSNSLSDATCIGEPGTGADFLHDGLFDPRVQGRRAFKRE